MRKNLIKMKFASNDYFNEWYDTYGIRTYSKNHGTAQGHMDYMKASFLAGYHTYEKNDSLLKELREENQRLKDALSAL
jgi:hypothetical protein